MHKITGLHTFFIPLYLCNQEIVPLRKVCRRPETDYRLQQLHAAKGSTAQHLQKAVGDSITGNAQQTTVPETIQKHQISPLTVSPAALAPSKGTPLSPQDQQALLQIREEEPQLVLL